MKAVVSRKPFTVAVGDVPDHGTVLGEAGPGQSVAVFGAGPVRPAPVAYRNFDQRQVGWTKVLLHP
ncbi:MAG TPA: hypothetical protein VHL53_09775 [Acidimicrobiia bacterium]|nr:hypothetical protein [Acidimicrobiia bacterium]